MSRNICTIKTNIFNLAQDKQMQATRYTFNLLGRLFFVAILSLISLSSAFAVLPTEHSIIMDDGHKLFLYSRISENPSASILLIHGRTWSALPDFDLITPQEDLSMMNALAKQGLAVYAVDLRGYGKSARDKSGWNTPNRAAKDIANVLDYINGLHQSLEGTSVFGWSNGSKVALLTAQHYPDKVKSIILYGFPIDTELKIPIEPQNQPPLKKATTAEAAAEDFITPGTISSHAIAAYVKATLAADPIRSDWNQLNQWNQLDAEKVSVPTLLLQAESDPYMNVDADALFFKKLATQDKQWIILSNADHAALLETARFRFYNAVVNFIRWTDL